MTPVMQSYLVGSFVISCSVILFGLFLSRKCRPKDPYKQAAKHLINYGEKLSKELVRK